MNLGTAFVLLILIVIVGLAARSTFGWGRKKKTGKNGGCGSGCSSCPYCSSCHK